MTVEAPSLEVGSPLAVALHQLWNGVGDVHVPTTSPAESDLATAAVAVHVAKRSGMEVMIWTCRGATIVAELARWMSAAEFGVSAAAGVRVVVDVPPKDHHPHDATVLVHRAMQSPATSSTAAVDVGGAARTIRLLPGADLGAEPLDIAFAGGV